MTSRGWTEEREVVFLSKGRRRNARRKVERALTSRLPLERVNRGAASVRFFPSIDGGAILTSSDTRIFNEDIQSSQILLN